jgi:hypothetical protein
MTAETKDETLTMALANETTALAAATAAPEDPSPTAPACPAARNARRYTPEIAARILGELEKSRSLLSICQDEGMPSYRTVYGWVLRNVEGFAFRYARAIDIGGRRGARAIQYTDAIADHIIGGIERGRSLADVCRDEGMPSYRTVMNWIGRNDEFAARYYRARAIGDTALAGKDLYTAETADRIVAGIDGGRTLFDICLDDDMPSEKTVCKWVREDREGFAGRYYAARAAGRCKLGRPTLYTEELAELILLEVAERRSLRDICRAPGMPSAATVRLWVVNDRDGFGARFERARKFALLDTADELLEIVDDGRNDWMERRAEEGDPAAAQYRETAKRSRLRFEGRRWILSKELPEIYGDRIERTAKEDAGDPMAEFMKLIGEQPRGLPSEEEPVTDQELDEFERKLQGNGNGGLPTDRL